MYMYEQEFMDYLYCMRHETKVGYVQQEVITTNSVIMHSWDCIKAHGLASRLVAQHAAPFIWH